MKSRRIALAATLVATAVASLGARAAHASPDDGRVTAGVNVERVTGESLRARAWTAVEDGVAVFETEEAAQQIAQKIPLADLIEISLGTRPDPPREFTAEEVAIDLWSGEMVVGVIEAGDERAVSLRTPLLGLLRVELEAIAGVRFPRRLADVADPPDLRSLDDNDVIHLTGGDRIVCTLNHLDVGSLSCATDANDAASVPYERITALRLMPTGWAAPLGPHLTAVLRDGSRVMGGAPVLTSGRLRLAGVSGFDVTFALSDAVSVLVGSDRFTYLSDLQPADLDVKPFWKPIAGDPERIYAPQTDRAFSGGLLACGGRTWLKGLGVFSGTSLTFDLTDGGYREFRTRVGIDDGAGRLGGAVFVVLVDGEERWRSDLVRPARDAAGDFGTPGPVDAGRIPIAGANSLVLRVLAGTSDDPYPIQDEADWLGAMLVR